MKALLIVALLGFLGSAWCYSDVYNDIMSYEMSVEGALANLTTQMNKRNASRCINNTHQVVDLLVSLISYRGYVQTLTDLRDLFMRLIEEIDNCPEMVSVLNRVIEVFGPLFTDPYNFIWKLANNLASNGIDIYYHIGYAVKLINGIKTINRLGYYRAGTVFGDMLYDIFFSS